MKNHVLIVDDNPENLYMLRALLEGHGYRVTEAENGEQALARARSDPPDLVITDILMPVMDGFTLCREWKKDETLKDRPFVFYTATYTDQKDEEFALSLGAVRFIIKPADPDIFIHSVEEVLRDVEEGRVVSREAPPQDEAYILKRYNQRLINKLEKKMQDLEKETALRRRSQRRLELLVRLFLELGSDFRNNMRKMVEFAREVLEVPLVAYLRWERDQPTLITSDGRELRLGDTTRAEDLAFFKTMGVTGDNRLIIAPLGNTPYCESDPLAREGGFDSVLGSLVPLEGKTAGVLGCYRKEAGAWNTEDLDIVEMLAKALSIEEERLAYEERTKDFIDVASHEIRHPVTVIMGYARSMREFWEQLDREKLLSALEAIEFGSERLETLSKKLLDVSYIQRGLFRVEQQLVELNLLFSRWYELASGGMSGDRLVMRRQTDLGKAWVDPQRLEELLDILVGNAAKFSPPDSPIEVEIAREGDWLEGAVMDRGCGVPAGMEEKIFERFFEVEDTQHHSLPGMGIGLHIAREIVMRHNGKLWYEHREGGGSVFRFRIKA